MARSYPDKLKWINTHGKFKLDKLDRELFDELISIRNTMVHRDAADNSDQIINFIETSFRINFNPSLS